MPRIRVLPDTLASQVAAGEVVERPASVVKELVENSIDAGAREILVEIQQGGVTLIRVQDDGCGMGREDALLSLERHATSKLRSAEDLAAIRTLGFRGEAIPSVASVSRMRLITREAESPAGTEIQIEGGRIRDVRDAGCAPGTVMEIRSLFYNVPARRKFLRAESTEAAHVEHQLILHALAAPRVRFRLRRNEREVFDHPAVGTSLDRVRQLVGTGLARELVSLPPLEREALRIEGCVLPAGHARKGRRHQHVLLNGRPVEDATISRALAEGFRGELAEGLYPAAWLWIDMDPAAVDVNVHPAKREVRLHRPAELRAAIAEIVSEGLRQARAASLSVVRPAASAPPIAVSPANAGVERDVPAPRADVPRPAARALRDHQPDFTEWQPVVPAAVPVPAQPVVPALRVLGVLHRRLVVLESRDGMVLLDPRAARERICYEALLKQEVQPVQPLLVPVLIDLDARDHDELLRARDALAAAGIEIDDFGGRTIQVRAMPAGLDARDPKELLSGIIDALLDEQSPAAGRFARERMARICARRATAGVEVRAERIPALLVELFACEQPYATADGSPILQETGMSELERRFGAKGGARQGG